MRFMALVKSSETLRSGPPPKALVDAIGQLGIEATQSGVMVESGGLLPSSKGALVRLTGGKVTVLDGPFSEAKEVIGGYAVFELKSREDAINQAVKFMELHRQHWPGWEGESEVRQIMDPPDFPPQG